MNAWLTRIDLASQLPASTHLEQRGGLLNQAVHVCRSTLQHCPLLSCCGAGGRHVLLLALALARLLCLLLMLLQSVQPGLPTGHSLLHRLQPRVSQTARQTASQQAKSSWTVLSTSAGTLPLCRGAREAEVLSKRVAGGHAEQTQNIAHNGSFKRSKSHLHQFP